jgi:alpha-L-rhamnosidase
MHSGFAYFLYAHVAGIKPLTPGFATFEVSPCDYTAIPSATVSHISPYGEIKVAFQREEGKTTYTITVPAGSVGYFRKGNLVLEMGSGAHEVMLRN